MSKWNILNRELDDVLSTMTPAAWDIWHTKFKLKHINQMTTNKVTIEDVVTNDAYCPIPVDVFPNLMGINLVSVDSVEWIEQEDEQIVSITINFIPNNDKTK